MENLTITRPLSRWRWLRPVRGEEVIVNDISFSLEKGASLSLVGDERSGTFPLTLGLLKREKIRSGRIVFGGIDLTSLSERRMRSVRRRIQAVFPHHFGQLSPTLTLLQSFREVLRLRYRNEGKDGWHHRVETVMIACGLPEAVKELYPIELDAVERQQAALARALLSSPELLIAYGFTDGLDSVQQAELLNLLRHVREEWHLSLLVLTDDLAVGHHLGDAIGVMHQGNLLEYGDADILVSRPEHDYTRRLVSCSL